MTLLKRAMLIAMLGAAIPALAQSDNKTPNAAGQPTVGHDAAAAGNGPTVDSGVKPRKPHTKRPSVQKPEGPSRLMVKFMDGVRARAQADKTVALASGVDRTSLDGVTTRHNLKFVPAIKVPVEELRDLERRAAMMSNKAQPDLAGLMYVEGPASETPSAAAANDLLKLGEVEYAFFDVPKHPTGFAPVQDGGGDDGGIAGGDPDCGDCGACGDCLTPTPGTPFCADAICCDLVGNIRPFCTTFPGGEWDELCVAIAHLFCDPGIGADRCASLINGSCFEEHPLPGCVDETCCNVVCAIDPFCCENEWDEGCVALAEANCVNPGGGPTPDFTNRQGYLTRFGYALQPGGVPPGLAPPAPNPLFGFGGEGFFLFDDQYLTDHPEAPIPQRYSGLYGLGRQLLEEYGVGPYNMTRGRGVKVAVIEWAYYAGHEDLDVIPEPGQTMIMIPEVTSPEHATACLGIINAQINGFGMNGIAPDAQAYFFPITSVEEGPREFAAWVRMMQTLGHGDVVSCSYGPGVGLNCVEANWDLIRMASDLGITVCVSAANSCINLDNAEDFGDSGAMVVGAGTPGRDHTRLTFSNYYQDGTPLGDDANGNVVHIQGWGASVPSLGGSANLNFPGGNWNRSYCSDFNGTSAAAPQVAALAACLQGLAKQFYDIPLMPDQIRLALVNTGFPQGGVPNPDNLGGFDEALGCGPDTDPEEGPNKIGPFPRPERAGYFILNQDSVGFDDAPHIDDVLIIRGNLLAGNHFSLKGRQDGNFLVVESLYTLRKHRPNLPGPAGKVTYLGTGQIADIMATAHMDTVSNNMTVSFELVPPGVVSFLITEAFDFISQKWTLFDFETLPATLPDDVPLFGGAALVPFSQRHINPADNNAVHIRQYVLGLGLTQPYIMRWDWLDVQLPQDFGGGGPGSG
jgi:hypothetical protein